MIELDSAIVLTDNRLLYSTKLQEYSPPQVGQMYKGVTIGNRPLTVKVNYISSVKRGGQWCAATGSYQLARTNCYIFRNSKSQLLNTVIV